MIYKCMICDDVRILLSDLLFVSWFYWTCWSLLFVVFPHVLSLVGSWDELYLYLSKQKTAIVLCIKPIACFHFFRSISAWASGVENKFKTYRDLLLLWNVLNTQCMVYLPTCCCCCWCWCWCWCCCCGCCCCCCCCCCGGRSGWALGWGQCWGWGQYIPWTCTYLIDIIVCMMRLVRIFLAAVWVWGSVVCCLLLLHCLSITTGSYGRTSCVSLCLTSSDCFASAREPLQAIAMGDFHGRFSFQQKLFCWMWTCASYNVEANMQACHCHTLEHRPQKSDLAGNLPSRSSRLKWIELNIINQIRTEF